MGGFLLDATFWVNFPLLLVLVLLMLFTNWHVASQSLIKGAQTMVLLTEVEMIIPCKVTIIGWASSYIYLLKVFKNLLGVQKEARVFLCLSTLADLVLADGSGFKHLRMRHFKLELGFGLWFFVIFTFIFGLIHHQTFKVFVQDKMSADLVQFLFVIITW